MDSAARSLFRASSFRREDPVNHCAARKIDTETLMLSLRCLCFDWVDVGPQLVARNASDALNVEDTSNRNAPPLRNGPLRYVERVSKLCWAASRLEREYECPVLHTYIYKHDLFDIASVT